MPDATVSCFLYQISPGITLLYWGYVFACLLASFSGRVAAGGVFASDYFFVLFFCETN
jgi:hypothetical protein